MRKAFVVVAVLAGGIGFTTARVADAHLSAVRVTDERQVDAAPQTWIVPETDRRPQPVGPEPKALSPGA